MAILLDFKGICEGCGKAELTLSAVHYTSDDMTENTLWSVKCEHSEACRRLWYLMTEKEEKR